MEGRVLCLLFFLVINQDAAALGLNELCARFKNDNVDCFKQMFGNDTDGSLGSCSLTFIPTNSSECFNKVYADLSTSQANLGSVKLIPYLYLYGTTEYTAFNVVIDNIKWKNFSFRFQANIDYETNKIYKNHCRDITVGSVKPLTGLSSLSYDCLWSGKQDRLYQDVTYVFQYEASDGNGFMNGKFVFIVPRAETVSPNVSLSRWKPFVYVEIKMDKMILHIAAAPQAFEINGYEISVYTNSSKAEPLETHILNATKYETLFEFFTNGRQEHCHFEVTPLSKLCFRGVCNRVESAVIEMGYYQETLLICIASTASLIAALIVFSIFLWKRYRSQKTLKHINDVLLESAPRLLIVYKPVNKIHVEAVTALVDCLRENGTIVSHDGDIERTAHGDPYVWCQREFQRADCILYVVGPVNCEWPSVQSIGDESYACVHKNVDVLTLKFLRDSMADDKSLKKLVTATFDYCTGGRIPKEMCAARNFQLPNDWNSMMQYIYKGSFGKDVSKKTEKEKILLANFLLCINRAKYLRMSDSCGNSLEFDDRKILI